VTVFGSPGINLVNQSYVGVFKCTHCVSTTVGMIPSIVFSSFGSAPETSQMMIFPSQPQVAYMGFLNKGRSGELRAERYQ